MTAVTFPLRPPRLALAICGRRWQNEFKVYISKFRCRNNKQQTTSKEETWSRGRNSRLPIDVNVILNFSIVLKNITTNTPSHGTQLKLNCFWKSCIARSAYLCWQIFKITCRILANEKTDSEYTTYQSVSY